MNQQESKALVQPPPPGNVRLFDISADTASLILSPTAQGSVGTSRTHLPQDPYFYESVLVELSMTVTPSGASGALPKTNQEQYNFINQLRNFIDDRNQFYTVSGISLLLMELLNAQYRGGQVVGNDILLSSASSGAKTVKLSYLVPFYCSLLEPSMLNLITGYGHTNNSFIMEIDYGNVTSFISGDTAATMSSLTITMTAQGYDYRSFQFGDKLLDPSLKFARFEPYEILIQTTGVSTMPGQQIEIVKALSLAHIMVIDAAADTFAPNAGNASQIQQQFNTNDYPLGTRTTRQLQILGNKAARTDLFTNNSNFLNVYPLIFTDRRAYQQLIHTAIHAGTVVDKLYVNVTTATSGKYLRLLISQVRLPAGIGVKVA